MRADYFVIFSSGITLLMWGLWGFFGKLAIERNMSPVSIFLAEVLICLVCAVFVFLFFFRTENFLPCRVPWNIFGFLSGVSLALGLVFYYFALQRGHASLVVPLTSLYPAVTVVLSYAILAERPSLTQWIGLILILIGAFLLLSGPIEGRQGNYR
ncbi:MAG: EamA family transporter [Candidatus Jettenia sp.]|nr:EamA family transporter [Candidatus Jettenia sp.]